MQISDVSYPGDIAISVEKPKTLDAEKSSFYA
jgi:hypothetical protein